MCLYRAAAYVTIIFVDAGVDYTRGVMHLDGSSFGPGDIDKIFDDFVIAEKASVIGSTLARMHLVEMLTAYNMRNFGSRNVGSHPTLPTWHHFRCQNSKDANSNFDSI